MNKHMGVVMFKRILVPVDLQSTGNLDKALNVAADQAKHYGAAITYVAVSPTGPDAAGATPEAHGQKLAEFAKAQSAAHGIEADHHLAISHDPAVEINRMILDAVESTGADLVIMASHDPGWIEHLFPAHGASVAAHAHVSVMVVRG